MKTTQDKRLKPSAANIIVVDKTGHLSKLIPPRRVQAAVKTTFSKERKKMWGDINVVFVNQPEIKRINKNFLNHNRTTDVIAFNYDRLPGNSGPFGDIFISIPEARTNARRFDQEVGHELLRLVIHGTLHLLGHDDHAPEKKKKMWRQQEAILNKLNTKAK